MLTDLRRFMHLQVGRALVKALDASGAALQEEHTSLLAQVGAYTCWKAMILKPLVMCYDIRMCTAGMQAVVVSREGVMGSLQSALGSIAAIHVASRLPAAHQYRLFYHGCMVVCLCRRRRTPRWSTRGVTCLQTWQLTMRSGARYDCFQMPHLRQVAGLMSWVPTWLAIMQLQVNW